MVVGSLSTATDYASGFNGRETFDTLDTVDEVMMEIRESLSLTNIDQISYKNSYELKVMSPKASRFPAMSPNPEEKPHLPTILLSQFLISTLITIFLTSSLYMIATHILNLEQCEYHTSYLSTMYIQFYHSLVYVLYLLPILWIVLDEFNLKISTLKRIWITAMMSLVMLILFLSDALWPNGIGIFLWNGLSILIIICIMTLAVTLLFGYRVIYMLVPLLIPLSILYGIYHLLLYSIFNVEEESDSKYFQFWLFAVIYPVILRFVELVALKSIQHIQLPFSFSSIQCRCSIPMKFCNFIPFRNRSDSDSSEHDADEGTRPTTHQFEDIKLEDAVSEQYLFLVSSMMAIFISTLQSIGYLVLVVHGHLVEMAVLSILDVVLEVFARNNLWNEMYLKIRYQSTKRDFTSFFMSTTAQMYYGSKCIMQYVPLTAILMLNLLPIGLY